MGGFTVLGARCRSCVEGTAGFTTARGGEAAAGDHGLMAAMIEALGTRSYLGP